MVVLMVNLRIAFTAFAFLACMQFVLAGASTPTAVSFDSKNYHISSSVDLFFSTDISGYPSMKLTYDPTKVVLDPQGASHSDLPNNAVLCPGAVSAVMSTSDIKWVRSYYNGSSWFPSIPPPNQRAYPQPWPGGNPTTTNVPVLFDNPIMGNLTTGTVSSNNLVRRIDAVPWAMLVAVATTHENSKYTATITPLNSTNSAASNTSQICNGSVIFNGAQYLINGSDTYATVLSNPQAGQSYNINGSIRIDKCLGAIHAIPDDSPPGTSGADRIYLNKIPIGTSPYPYYSTNASMSVSFLDPQPSASVVGGPYGPYQLNNTNSTIVNVSVTNAASSFLPFNVTGVYKQPGFPSNSITVSLVPGTYVINPGQTGYVLVNITQGSPPYNGSLNLFFNGTSVGVACNNSKMIFYANWSTTIINNTGSGGGTVSWVCLLFPNPAVLGVDPIYVNASCIRILNGVPSNQNCPPFTWSTTSPNTILTPSSTGSMPHPNVSVSYSGYLGAGGTITATNGSLSCSTPVYCGSLSCQITSNLTGNIIVPPQTMGLTASCSNATTTTLKCPNLNWYHNLTNATLQYALTSAAISPTNSLYTTLNTPSQTGKIWGNSTSYCAPLNCTLPASSPNIVVNQNVIVWTCSITPNPLAIGVDAATISATCTKYTNGVPQSQACPPFTWTTNSPNTTLTPSSTSSQINPPVSVNYTGTIGAGGTITASNGSLSCNTTISCAPLSCQIASNLTGNIISPPATMGLTASCSNATSSGLKCPKLYWYHNLTNATLQYTLTNPMISPTNSLYTTMNTPSQTGKIWGNSTTYCAPLNCTLPASTPNIIVTRTTINYVCIINPNPIMLGVDAVSASASCIKITNGTPSLDVCPPFTWTTNSPNTTLNSSTTPSQMTPAVLVNYSGFMGPGGTLAATNGSLTCNTSVACGPLFCSITSNMSGNLIAPPMTLGLAAACSNSSSSNLKCPKMGWFHNLINVSLQYANTNASFSPQNSLYTNGNTPPQSGRLWANSTYYCNAFNCNLSANITIGNRTCNRPCNVSGAQASQYLYSGMVMQSNATCYYLDPLTHQIIGIAPCPLATWYSNAGNMTPNITAGSNSPMSNLTVSNVSGTFVRVNYTDPGNGAACSCNFSLRSALPDYIPIFRLGSSGPIPLGNAIQVYVSTKNNGSVIAVNTTFTQTTIPSGGSPSDIFVPLLGPGVTTSETQYNYTCVSPGLFDFDIVVDKYDSQAETDETNNAANGSINCGNVLVCRDYI